MLTPHQKELLAKMELEYAPIAVKFSHNLPDSIERCHEKLPLCAYLKTAQDTGKTFYVDLKDEACMGSCVLGYKDFEGFASSGVIGFEHGFFRSAACNARIYHEISTLKRGSCNYVVFSPAVDCNFSPDLIIFVVPPEKAELVLRASSYTNGDPYESKSTIALSCAWTYAYPYITGKINFCITGVHFGMRKMKMYPAGLHVLTVPYQKIDDLLIGLDEMEWDLIGLTDDPEIKAISDASDAKAMAMADAHKPFGLDERLRSI